MPVSPMHPRPLAPLFLIFWLELEYAIEGLTHGPDRRGRVGKGEEIEKIDQLM